MTIITMWRRLVSGYYWARVRQMERLAIDLAFKVHRLEAELLDAQAKIAALEAMTAKRRPGRPRKSAAPETSCGT